MADEDAVTPHATPGLLFETGLWRILRPTTDPRKCRRCALCWMLCPSGARRDMSTHFDIDLSVCKGCGICARECFAGAIIMVDESAALERDALPENQREH